MNQDWQNSYFFILFGVAILHGIYLSLLVFLKARPVRGHAWLGLLLLAVSSLLINYFLYISGAINQYPHLLNVFVPLPYLMGPSLYFFIRVSGGKIFRWRWLHLLHMLPLAWVLWQSIGVYQWSAADKLRVIDSLLAGHVPTFTELLIGNKLNFITIGYAIAAFVLLYKEQGSLWLKRFAGSFIGLVVLAITLPAIMLLLSMDGAYFELVLTLAYSICLHVLGFAVLSHGKAIPWAIKPEKYHNSSLSGLQLSEYQQQIIDHLEKERPWLNAQFSIAQLSNATDIPKHHLSQVINQHMQLSFTDLINSYRVELSMQMLKSEALEKYSMLGIATDCGFASKSTFNRAFKKHTGLTPSAYLSQAEMAISASTSAE